MAVWLLGRRVSTQHAEAHGPAVYVYKISSFNFFWDQVLYRYPFEMNGIVLHRAYRLYIHPGYRPRQINDLGRLMTKAD